MNSEINQISKLLREREQLELSLRESEERYSNLVQSSLVGVLRSTTDGKIIYINKAIADMLEFDDINELVSLGSVTRYKDTNQRDEIVKLLKENGKVESFEANIITEKGNDRVVLMNLLLKNEIIDGTLIDITDRKKIENEYKEAKDRAEEVFNTSPDGAVITRLSDGLIVNVNEIFVTNVGYSKEEVIGKLSLDINLWKYPAERESFINMLKKNGYCDNFKNTIKRKDGSTFIGLMSAKVFTFNGIPHIISSTRDITELDKINDELILSEERFRNLFNDVPIGLYRTTPDGRILMANKMLLKILGFSSLEELSERNLEKVGFGPTYQRDFFKEQLEKYSEVKDLEANWIRKDGRVIIVRENAKVIKDDIGKILYYDGTVEDITKRKENEIALNESEAYSKMLFNKSPIGLALCKMDGSLVDINPAYSNIIGRTVDEALKLTYWDITPEKYADQEAIQLKLLSETGSYGPYEKDYIHKDGHLVPVRLTGLIIEQKGERYIWSSVEDITAKKKSEEEIKQKNEQLLLSNSEKDKFFSIIAHDLKGPFSIFLKLIGKISEKFDNMTLVQIKEIMNIINESASNLYSLLENLLEWAKMQRGLTEFNPEIVVLADVVHSSIAPLKESARQKDIEIHLKIDNFIQVYVDIRMLEAILRNLISNALKFTPRNGVVLISANKSHENIIEISVKDNGIGMNEDILNNLFKTNARSTRPGTEGELSSGLGLLLSKEFIEKHNGNVTVKSEVDKGSTFSFTLPV